LLFRELAVFDFSWLFEVPRLARLVCWTALLLEVCYPVSIWPRRPRGAWALGIIGMHLGIALTMRLWSFSAVMIVLNAAAFLVSADPAPPDRKSLFDRRPKAQ
jgi:hypothetical protein